jgi:hypothetical protein
MKNLFLAVAAVLVWMPARVQGQEASATPTAQFEGAFSKDWWLKVYAGYDYSLMGDVINGVKAWQGYVQGPGVSSSLSTGNSGFVDGMEIGFSLDATHSLSLEAENIGTQNESISYTSGGTANRLTVGPSLEDINLNYYHTLFRTKDSATYVFIGGGYYHANVDYYNGSGPSTSQSATFTGDIIGGVLGLTEKLAIANSFTCGFSVKGRLAAFSEVNSSSIIINGSTQTANAPYALMIFNPGLAGGAITAGSPSSAGSSVRYAVVDYSGFTGDVFLAFHF